ncbi:MAG: 50S ribosomal protein L25 [Candidatus Veblenbacteria bacterium]|nr:50S ribosomal protein L25 [Candidatus Veblenbacteria bacterium]
MSTLTVTSRRPQGKGTRVLRRQGGIPGVVYGHGVASQTVAVDAKAFGKVYRQVGETTLLDLVVDSNPPVKVLVQEVQLDPLSEAVQHVDFHQIRMDEKLEVDIPLKFVGEAPAVKELGGTLVRAVNEIKVRCLPQHLVHEIEVNIGSLAQLNDVITLGQVTLPTGLEVLSPGADEVIATAIPPRSEAELAELKADVKEDVSVVAVEEKGKEEAGAVGAETTAAPPAEPSHKDKSKK